MELIERLNEVENGQVQNKAQARLLVVKDIFDEVILHDRTYSNVLLKIRAEFNRYFESCSPNQDLDSYLLKTENNALKKLSLELQNEIAQLRQDLLSRPSRRVEDDDSDDTPLQLPETNEPRVPSIVPKLDFGALSPFQEDEYD
ncbi:hypothetical protein THRCLA_11497 [Thraustotheca clavata]|uniref:Translin-associated factor X-interacting protein 1 N-terminal domain-containing protein n=1 Tax=Thraustotheca clavata TaxID=74557 RepID=A0A1V9Y7J4_9STRA|nr:hypothetical protein THRCLA_11497 [Thraustotheca clavata]